MTEIILALVVTAPLVWLSFPLARRTGLVAAPGDHRRHEGDVPLTGGLAMVAGGALTILLLGVPVGPGLVLGVGMLLLVGLLDDRYSLPYWVRFLFQTGAMLSLMWLDGVRLVDLGRVFSVEVAGLGAWSGFLTVFAGVGVINAVNMVDGMDGLAGSLAVVCLGATAWLTGSTASASLSLALVGVGVTLGFLLYNLRFPGRHRARVFMGDAGSMVLGLLMASLLIGQSQGDRAFPPVVALWLLCIPLFDAVGVLLRRPASGGSPFDADWRHTHHLLQRLGYRVNTTLAIMFATALLLALLGIGLWRAGVAEHRLFYLFLAVFMVYLAVMAWGERRAGPAEPGNGNGG